MQQINNNKIKESTLHQYKHYLSGEKKKEFSN